MIPANDNKPPRGLSWGDRLLFVAGYGLLALKLYLFWSMFQ